jgi:crotonobetainyl-CoA:carnitine CoA-transferase CaiB-like acyl-CoA transferase
MQGLIAQLSRTPGRIRSPGPTLGEHNDDVLRDQLRYPQDVLDDLTEAGVIGPTRTPISTNQGRS